MDITDTQGKDAVFRFDLKIFNRRSTDSESTAEANDLIVARLERGIFL
jgi:hypothetical protein